MDFLSIFFPTSYAYMERITTSETIDPIFLVKEKKRRFIHELYEIQCQIFQGVDINSFTSYIIRPGAVRPGSRSFVTTIKKRSAIMPSTCSKLGRTLPKSRRFSELKQDYSAPTGVNTPRFRLPLLNTADTSVFIPVERCTISGPWFIRRATIHYSETAMSYILHIGAKHPPISFV